MFYQYEIHIKLKIKDFPDKKEIEDILKTFMGVDTSKTPDDLVKFVKARKMVDGAILKKGG